MSRSLGVGRTSALLKVVMAFALVLTCLSIARPAAEANAAAGPATRGSSADASSAKKAAEKKAPKFSAGEVIVRYAPTASAAAKRSANRKAGGDKVTKLGSTVPGLSKVKLKKGVSVEEAVAAYNRQPGVLYAEPNYRGTIDAVPDDPDFGSLWGLENTGQEGGVEDADIDASAAWDKATGSGDVIVAVVDTGVDYTHPELDDNMWTNTGEIAGNEIDDDNNGYVDDVYGVDVVNGDSDPMDDYGHGTHCAGTIGAEGNNALGVVGVNWDVRIMAVKWIDADGWGYTDGAIEALDYAHAMGADITSNSWHVFEYSQALSDAIAASGTLDVFAAGNDESNTDAWVNHPSAYDVPNILAVGASNRFDEMAWFSNYGLKTVDLFAPGEDILSTVPDASYDVYSGTSMATPHVAGVAALLLSQNPGASWESLKLALMGSAEARPAFDGRCLSGGRLNADYALDAVALEPGTLTGSVTDTDGVPLEGVSVSVGSTLYDTTGADGSYSISGITPGTYSVVCSSPDYLTKVVPGVVIEPAGAHTLDVALQLAGKVSGTVTGLVDGLPIEGIQVTAYQEGGVWGPEPVASAVTASDGTYIVGGLDTASYWVEFADSSGNYVLQYYDGQATIEAADPVDVTAGETTPMIDAALEEYGKVSGTVVGPDGSPVAGAWVSAYQSYDGWWEQTSGAETAEDGTYILGGLTTGTYRVEFLDPSGTYAYEYYDDAVSVEAGDDVAVTTGSTTPGIDAKLGVAGWISGTVTAAADGAPLSDVWVSVYRNNGGSWDQVMLGAATAEDGSYAVGGLPSGTYRVEFYDWEEIYASEFYKAKPSLRTATPIRVKAGFTKSGIDATLDPVGGISGTVTSAADGTPVAGAWVNAYRKFGKTWEWYRDTETAEDGSYSVSGLPAGTYRVEFYDPSGTYSYEFYDNKGTLDRATGVTVAVGAFTPDINAALELGGQITGTVTTSDGAPIETAFAVAFRKNGAVYEPVSYAEGSPDGTYTLGGLPAGTYRVEFLDWSSVYAFEYYDNAATLRAAKDIVVASGQMVSGIDATLEFGGQITGTVTSAADGMPLEEVWVTAYLKVGNTWEPWFGTATGADGSYAIGGLSTGSYRIEFMDGMGRYEVEYFDNKATLSKATDIGVVLGETTSSIDAALEPWTPPTGSTPTSWIRGAGPAFSSIGIRERLPR